MASASIDTGLELAAMPPPGSLSRLTAAACSVAVKMELYKCGKWSVDSVSTCCRATQSRFTTWRGVPMAPGPPVQARIR